MINLFTYFIGGPMDGERHLGVNEIADATGRTTFRVEQRPERVYAQAAYPVKGIEIFEATYQCLCHSSRGDLVLEYVND